MDKRYYAKRLSDGYAIIPWSNEVEHNEYIELNRIAFAELSKHTKGIQNKNLFKRLVSDASHGYILDTTKQSIYFIGSAFVLQHHIFVSIASCILYGKLSEPHRSINQSELFDVQAAVLRVELCDIDKELYESFVTASE